MKFDSRKNADQPILLAATALLLSLLAVGAARADNSAYHGGKPAKYVFFFIGDGMAMTQRNVAEAYLAAQRAAEEPGLVKLTMSHFPAQGMCSTYSKTGLITDSAASGTALACGFKTANGVISMNAAQSHRYKTMAQLAKDKGLRVGIVSSVSIDHATPACFYAHAPSRSDYYGISMQLARSDFDYFAGGGMRGEARRKGRQSPLDAARRNGFTIVTTRRELSDLQPDMGKVYAYNHTTDGAAALYYELDRPADHISLAEFTRKGIELLDNPEGFFMMVEGGKIDWACHANDAGAAIHDTLAFDAAVKEAVNFYLTHQDETLIVVTGDHECGGMSMGFAGTKYSTFFDVLAFQKDSYLGFGEKLSAYKKTHPAGKATFDEVVPMIEESFGLIMPNDPELPAIRKKAEAGDRKARARLNLVLKPHEVKVLQTAFAHSMQGEKKRSLNDYTYLMYGGYDPLTVKLTQTLNQKAGLAWTSYSHTGVPVPVSAIGVAAATFNGYYDNTHLGRKIMAAMGVRPQAAALPASKQAEPAPPKAAAAEPQPKKPEAKKAVAGKPEPKKPEPKKAEAKKAEPKKAQADKAPAAAGKK